MVSLGTTVNNPGISNGVADAILLTKWSGQTIKAYHRKSVTEGFFRTLVPVTGTNVVQFPVQGRLSAGKIHVLGESTITTNGYNLQLPQNQITVTLERPYISAQAFDKFDAEKVHFPFMGEYAYQQGEDIARFFDRIRMSCVALGAAASATITGLKPQTTDLTISAFGSSATTADIDATIAAFFTMKERFDLNEVPEEGRTCFLTPVLHTFLTKFAAQDVIDMDITGGTPNGSVATGKTYMLAGWRLVPTTNYFGTNHGAVTGMQNLSGYAVNATNHKALFAVPDALGGAVMGGFGMKTELIDWNEGLAMQLRSMKSEGWKYLRPEACGLIRTA